MMTLTDALRVTAVDYAGSADERPNVTQYLLRAADALDAAIALLRDVDAVYPAQIDRLSRKIEALNK